MIEDDDEAFQYSWVDGASRNGRAVCRFFAKQARRGVRGLAAATLAGCVTGTGALTQPTVAASAVDPPQGAGDVSGCGRWRLRRSRSRCFRGRSEMVEDGGRLHDRRVARTARRRYPQQVSLPRAAVRCATVVGVGREGFEWSGRAAVAWQKAWPRWVPWSSGSRSSSATPRRTAAWRRACRTRWKRGRSTSASTARTRCTDCTATKPRFSEFLLQVLHAPPFR